MMLRGQESESETEKNPLISLPSSMRKMGLKYSTVKSLRKTMSVLAVFEISATQMFDVQSEPRFNAAIGLFETPSSFFIATHISHSQLDKKIAGPFV